MSTTVEIVLRGLDEVTPTFRSVGREAGNLAKDLKTSFEEAGRQISDVGGALTKLTAPIALAGGAAVKFSNDLNSAMGDVETMMPGATARIIEMKGEVQELAIAVGKNTTDIAGGLYEVIGGFGDTADSMATLEISAKAATAGVATTKDAIGLLSAVTKGYGDTSLAAIQNTADLAFMTTNLGQTTFPELAASIGGVVPLAAELGVKNTELFGTYATLTGVTGKASEVTTQFRGFLQALMSPTKDMSDLIGELGFSSGKAMLAELGLQKTIEAVTGAAKQTGKPLQMYISSIEGQTAALALAGGQAASFTEKIAAMSDVAGAAEEAFRAKTEGVNAAGFAWQQFQVKLEVTAQQLGDQLAPAFAAALEAAQPLFDAVKSGVEWFSGLDKETQQTIITIAAIVAAAGPVLVVIGQVVSAVGTLLPILKALSPVILTVTKAQGALNVAMTANPVGLVVAAIAALIAIGILLYKHWDEIVAFLSQTWETIKGYAVNVWEGIATFFTDLWNRITGFFVSVWEGIRDGISTAWTAIVDWFKEWWGTILLGVMTGGIGIVVALIVANWDKIKEFTVNAWNAVVDFFRNLWPTLQQLAVDGMIALATWLVEIAASIKQGWVNSWNAVLDFFKNLWPNIKELAVQGMQALLTWLVQKGEDTRQSFVDLWDGIIDFLKSLPQRMMDAGANIMKGLVRGIGSIRVPIPQISVEMVEGPLGINIPKLGFGVNWTSLADLIPWLADGGIAASTMIAGIGEAGPEAVLPLDRIVPLMARAINVAGGTGGGGDGLYIDMRHSTFQDGTDAGRRISHELERRGYRRGG